MSGLKGITQNLDLKSDVKTVSTVAVKLCGNSVPAGMKRWVTFVKISNREKGINIINLCSSISSNIASSSIAKDRLTLASPYDIVSYPERPSDLFSIASTAFLTAISSKGKADVFVQYYDS